ncbi:unnamed protein product [Rangifer tarandus platyrhynchus]|uniref:Uncharacterized protein n=2 Tax=Rangifer tarandus platyrhynchus TaxID=3082113 RepID=A0ABN8XNX6_RANTA|nr:unnamed protein product [Rangifer tarandus platyrhynchus]
MDRNPASEAAWDDKSCSTINATKLGSGLCWERLVQCQLCPMSKVFCKERDLEASHTEGFEPNSRCLQSPFLCPGDAAGAGKTPASADPCPQALPSGASVVL